MSRFLGRRTFGGGIRFRHYTGQPRPDTETLGVPRRVVIPMLQGYGVPAEPAVKQGESVLAGQIIGRDDSTVSSPVHATINGRVAEIARLKVGGRDVPVIVVEGDGTDTWTKLDGASAEWKNLSAGQLEDLLYRSGATGLAREGIPTRFRSAIIGPETVRHVIISQIGAERLPSGPGGPAARRRHSDFRRGPCHPRSRAARRTLPRGGERRAQPACAPADRVPCWEYEGERPRT